MECRIIDLQLFQRILDIFVLLALRRIDPAVYHRLYFFVTRQRLFCRVTVDSDGITDPCIRNFLDAGTDISYLAGSQRLAFHRTWRIHSNLGDLVFFIRIHQADDIALFDRAVKHSCINDDAFIVVVIGVKNQRFQFPVFISLRSRDICHDPFQQFFYADPLFCRNQRRILCVNAYHILYFLFDFLRSGRW